MLRFTPRRVVLLSLAVWCACVLLSLLVGPPLGPDEAAYARLARHDPHVELHRPVGMITIARIGYALGGSELALRMTSVLLGTTLIFAVAWFGRRFGPWVGAWATAVVVGTHAFTMRSFQLLNDLPATAGLLVASAIVIDELEREAGPTYRLVIVAPILAATFHLRYGTSFAIGVLALTAAAVWARSIGRRPGPVIVTALLFVFLLVPFLLFSLDQTGSVTGILSISRQAATFPLGQGLARFLLSNPFWFYGGLAPLAMAGGLVSIAFAPLRHRRRVLFMTIVSFAMIVWLGLTSDGSARFLFLPIVFLVVLSVDSIARALAASPKYGRAGTRLAVGIVIAGWASVVIATVPIQRHIARGLAGMTAASAAIRADAAGRPCVVAAVSVSQLMWYTGCEGFRVRAWEAVPPPAADARWYVVSMEHAPVELGRLANAAAIPLPGGTAWRLQATTRRPPP
ncbi:MAG TPA: hypothetical protein VNO30_44055 [Kofleriaceae bacterium]|nr:hypothetical protein [Kofleriaceae bacterium]